MLSSLFVDRPRLAIVIAIVTTIAGLLALYAIPFAQYPDIVPPQVSVTTAYPGANSTVVESTVAQVIEAQVVGVDKMIYMKSTSGDDGSYTLTASFELGTNPDINTVNVNNRVQVAFPSLPPEVQRQGVTVKKKSSALLGVIAVYSPKHTHDPLFLSNYVTINLLDRIKSTPGVGDAALWGPQDYAMRAWVRTDQLTGLNLTTADVINAIQTQNIQAAVGRVGARPISDDQQLQLNIQTKGRLNSVEDFENSSFAPIPTARCCACATLPGWRSARRISIATRGSTADRRRPSPSIKRPARTRSIRSRRCAVESRKPRRGFPRTWPGRSPTTRRCSSRIPSTRCKRP
jgi:multidrug efflux pump subunit AcrB